ncbi:cip1-interacting zinc finger protein [Rhinophrynus dorsalis]
MFNQQQQFHQLMQLQHLLQQQQQQQHPVQHHPAPRSMPPSVQHQQPQQMLNLRAANPARLLGTHPMLQRALIMQQMQGNLRGLSMAAPAMPAFFTAAARQSILGTPPMGVTVKGPRMGFPGMPFQQQRHRMYHKDNYRNYDRKRDGEHASSYQASGSEDKQSDKGELELPPTASEADENPSSSEDSENLTECSITDPLEPSAKRARSSESGAAEADFSAGGLSEDGDEHGERNVESQPPEGVSGGRALKVTIQQRSESRTISTTALKPAQDRGGTASTSSQAGPRFCCYICKANFHSLQNFQSHLVTARHNQRFQEIQHLSNACLVTLLPTAKDGTTAGRDGKKKHLRWCNVCQVHFSCDLIKHRRTQEHKLAKRSLRPFCTVCSRHFKTPRKFVEHMKSPEHKQKSQEVRLREKEPWTLEESEELITVDAVGCFEEEDDEEDEEEGISEDDPTGDTQCLPAETEETSFADAEHSEEYNSDTAYGLDFVVPVAGYLCRLCHKFYLSDSAARRTHCKSLMHFQNVQRYKAAKSHTATQVQPDSHSQKTDSQADDIASSLCTETQPVEDLIEQMASADDCVRAEDPAGEEDGKEEDLLLGEESKIMSEPIGSPSGVGTTEEDSGYFLEPDTLLNNNETNLDNKEVEGINTSQQETSGTPEDKFSPSCRRSSRHKPRQT